MSYGDSIWSKFWRVIRGVFKICRSVVSFSLKVLSVGWRGLKFLLKLLFAAISKFVGPAIALWAGSISNVSKVDENTVKVSSVHGFTPEERIETRMTDQVMSYEEFKSYDFGVSDQQSQQIHEQVLDVIENGNTVQVKTYG